MGKLEKPLTWVLIIGILGYLFMGNCCKTNSECDSENSFNWSEKVQDSEIEVKVIATDSDTDINIDSMITVVVNELEGDSTMEIMLEGKDLDTTIIESTTDENGTKTEKKVIVIKTTDQEQFKRNTFTKPTLKRVGFYFFNLPFTKATMKSIKETKIDNLPM